ncbi:hypothetical protein [Nocardioides sp. WS12]|uniref:hypothetical protein n=1 Tax=Nocardioides sp. WS12 TaxID=2486272 RepID=UPI0015FD58EB|nr:hypothetical protein [Nocardioides sp. WS12]
MAGENLHRLQRWTAGMDTDDVLEARGAWHRGAASLTDVRRTLKKAARDVGDGFGEESGVADSAARAFRLVARRLKDKEAKMIRAADVLLSVHTAMIDAQNAQNATPERPSDTPPKLEQFPGLPVEATFEYAVATAQYNVGVIAYNNADQDAAVKLARLNDAYSEAILVMKTIHGDPKLPVVVGSDIEPNVDPLDPVKPVVWPHLPHLPRRPRPPPRRRLRPRRLRPCGHR